MPFIKDLWIATLTSTRPEAGSESQLVVIMNQNGLDVVHRELPLGFGPAETGGGQLYRLDLAEAQVLPESYYMRIGTRGSDAWEPAVIAAWCERFTSGNVVPLGYDERIETVLSTDRSKGRISLPLRQIGGGMVRTAISRVMLVTGTGPGAAATDSPVRVRVKTYEGLVVDHTITDTPQADFEGSEGNVYFLPVLAPFTRSQLTDASILLSIEGNDAWLPKVVVMFGLDTASGQPSAMVPLVHVHPWAPEGTDPQWLSTDPTEGADFKVLPLAPIDT